MCMYDHDTNLKKKKKKKSTWFTMKKINYLSIHLAVIQAMTGNTQTNMLCLLWLLPLYKQKPKPKPKPKATTTKQSVCKKKFTHFSPTSAFHFSLSTQNTKSWKPNQTEPKNNGRRGRHASTILVPTLRFFPASQPPPPPLLLLCFLQLRRLYPGLASHSSCIYFLYNPISFVFHFTNF